MGYAVWNIEYRRVAALMEAIQRLNHDYELASPIDLLPFGVSQVLGHGQLDDKASFQMS
jgi:hypothetical protein